MVGLGRCEGAGLRDAAGVTRCEACGSVRAGPEGAPPMNRKGGRGTSSGVVVALQVLQLALGAVDLPAQPRASALHGILTADLSALPDAFTSQCGRQLSGAPGIGVTAAVRRSIAGALSAQVDTRVAVTAIAMGCDLDLPLVQLANGVVESRPGVAYDSGTPTTPLLATALRLGASRASGPVELTLLGGGGFIWRDRPLPLASVALSARAGRGHRALYLEVDRAQVWVRGTEARLRWLPSPTGTEAPVTYVVRRKVSPVWASVRIGVSFSRRGARSG